MPGLVTRWSSGARTSRLKKSRNVPGLFLTSCYALSTSVWISSKSMSKGKVQFQCNECGATVAKWGGQCPDCRAWNTLIEVPAELFNEAKSARFKSYQKQQSTVRSLDAIQADVQARISTGMQELDRVLGGGVVHGSVALIGGDPGIGKSTLLIQALASLTQNGAGATLYVSGEESAEQISQRAR